MAKKKGGKSKGYTSAGVNRNVAKKTTNAVRHTYESSADRLLNQYYAFKAGKNVSITIENPDKTQTNKRFIKVDGKQLFKLNPNERFMIR